ncbi:MAG: hypothetical protein QF858_02875 [Candidatus Pacebacteria bacterium]|jgi:hypothetical protein|nr:hypothetical protein [Candidatus Paceibacterota bacterium]HCI03742.1 hypothetical protein [Candidatus Peribacteria bacterium]|tara:strand:- start:2329 stop:3033 length:705 start_codon:yes stop_codon:yes gene_type:complete
MPLQKYAEGAGHEVFEDSEDPDVLVKKPKPLHKRHFDFHRVQEDLRLAHKHFGDYLPETTVQKNDAIKDDYLVRQERIYNAQHINPVLLRKDDIRTDVESILHLNRAALDVDGCGLDFIGLEGSGKCVLASAEKLRGSIVETLLIRPGLYFGKTIERGTPLNFPREAEDWWKRGETTPEISNLVYGESKNRQGVFVIDLSLVRTRGLGMYEKVRSGVLQCWNKHLLRKYFDLTM